MLSVPVGCWETDSDPVLRGFHAISGLLGAHRSAVGKLVIAAFAAAIAFGTPERAVSQAEDSGATPRPNIVLIVADDLGWGQPGFNGGTEVSTPNIDRIADEGVKLTQFYVQPQCAPTRAALLTGRYAWKNGVDTIPHPEMTGGLLLDERTIAEALGDVGYATWIVGKWHLGHWLTEHLPLQRGFDHHYGMYTGHIRSFTHIRAAHDRQVLDWHRNGRPVVESGYSSFLLADEAAQLIGRHNDASPFFLYLPFNAVHTPHGAPQEYLDLFSGLKYKQRAMLKAMDDAIGLVLAALEEKGVLDNTLVMFLSDNGDAPEARTAGQSPYRGQKATYFEGGIRVPAVARWPGEIPAGAQSDALLHAVDVFPTFAGLAGASTTDGLPLDGLDAWAAIANGAESPRTELVHSAFVLRQGDWKLIERIAHTSQWVSGELRLFNIAEDPYETTNLAETETVKVDEMAARLDYHALSSRAISRGRQISDSPVIVFGEEENEAFGTAVQAALTARESGNTGPTPVRLEAICCQVKLSFDEELDADAVPPASAFTVVVKPGYKPAQVEEVAVNGHDVQLTLTEARTSGETVGLTYKVPDTGGIRDKDDLEAAGVVWMEVRVSPPSAPEAISSIGLRASPGSGSVRLSWNLPSDNGGSAILCYEYRYAPTSEAWSEWESVGAGSGGVTVGGLINGQEYLFEVRAVNALGKGTVETTMATPEQVVNPPPPPPPPRGGGGGGGGGGFFVFPPEAPVEVRATAGDGVVRLEWSPPESDGGTIIRGYEYRLKEGLEEFGEWTPIEDSRPEEVNATGYTVEGLYNGTVYVVELRAVNSAGNGPASAGVEVRMRLDPAWWSNLRAEDLEGGQLWLEAPLLEGGLRERELRFGEGLRFEQDRLDQEGEVTGTVSGSYGYVYTSRRTGELSLDFDGGEACEVRLTFRGEGEGSYSYGCGGVLEREGSFGMSRLNRAPEITSAGPFEVEENTVMVGRLEAADPDDEDGITGYGIAGGADGALFRMVAETGELRFKEAPDYENPGDVKSEDPASEAGDNEYIVVVEVTSGEGERERSREQAIRVRVTDVEMEEAIEEETESLFIPVILSSAGQNRSFFTSELTLTNRGEQEVELDYTYTSRDEPEKRSGKASDVLAAGRQTIETYALDYLRDLGIPIPETGNQLGTLRVEIEQGSEVEAVVRTTTLVADGRAGLAYLGVAAEEGFSEAVYLCGLRQNRQDRSNVAFQNMGTSEEGAITLKTTVYSGEASDTSPRELDDVTLEPGGFHQYSGLLGSVENGYVKVERVEGEAPFYAYGVINDQANSDGSFVFPVTAGSLEGKRALTLPVIVETRDFTSELTVTNFSEEPRTLNLEFVSEQIQGDDKSVEFSMELEAGEQAIVPELVEELRREEMAKLGTSRGFYLGPLFVTAKEGDLSGIVIGARTSASDGRGGKYGVFYDAVPEGEAFEKEAWVEGLQQNEENRSNLALVNTGEVDDSESVFHLEIYNGETGMLEETVVTKAIPARGWHQIDGILLRANPETRQGYIRIERVSGENPFLAYGVVNDGGAPGERSGDGAYLPARQ